VAARDAYLNDKSRRLVRDVAISHRCRCHVPEANADAIFMQRGKGVIFAAHHRPVPGVRSCGACASPCTRASWPNWSSGWRRAQPRACPDWSSHNEGQRRGQLVLLASDLRL